MVKAFKRSLAPVGPLLDNDSEVGTMRRQRWALGLGATIMAATVMACQPLAAHAPAHGGELSMQVHWPLRTQAIPPDTAVIAVGVFRDGQLIVNGRYRVGIVGRGAGSIRYSGLANGDYRVVAGAFDKDARLLAGGLGTGTINVQASPRTQVQLSLAAGEPAADLNPYLPDIQAYLAAQQPEPLATGTPKPPGPAATGTPPTPPTTPPASSPPSQPGATSSPPPATGGGSGGGGGTLSNSTTVTFTGGFQ
jgi:hypothetical protein